MSLEEALERWHVWKVRSTRIPHAVESTASLAQVIWRDGTANMFSTELRLAYASAVLRSINGLADVLQQRRAVATSVHVLCRQLGIPAWLVDVRHESTHNQMPTLAVLRKAACALLLYFRNVYWQPLFDMRREQMDQAMTLLREYENSVNNTDVKSKSKAVIQEDKIDVEDENSSDSEAAHDDELWGFELPLGRTINRFAALQAPAKKRKVEPKSKCEKTNKRNRATDPNNPSPSTCARRFVKSNLPLDVARYSALSYLIWKGVKEQNDATGCGGVLFSSSVDSFNETKDDFQNFSSKYSPFLLSACRQWPGFLNSLLIHIVDAVLSIEDCQIESPPSPDAGRKLFYLESWIRFILSHSFLSGLFPEMVSSQKNRRPAEVVNLRSFPGSPLPLNSLCDRCSDRNTGDGDVHCSTSTRLAALFADILGTERTPCHGVALASGEVSNKRTVDKTQAQANGGTMSLATKSGSFSLEDMERLLDESHSPTESNTVSVKEVERNGNCTVAPRKPRSTWIRCESWDPCTIGTLPGFPI